MTGHRGTWVPWVGNFGVNLGEGRHAPPLKLPPLPPPPSPPAAVAEAAVAL